MVVPGVKADARLIQDIQGIDQRGAEGGGEGHALDLTAGKGPGLPIQCEIP